MALATYEPEIERYGGGELWRHSEVCFSADSVFACRMSGCIDADSLGEDAVVFTMAMSCLYLAADFGLSFGQTAVLLRGSRVAGGKPPQWQLESGAIFRRAQSWVTDIASGAWDIVFVRNLGQAAEERSRASEPAITKLAQSLRMEVGWREWLFRSHSHLSMNRMTRFDMVDAELLAMSLAARIANSVLARGLHELPSLSRLSKAH